VDEWTRWIRDKEGSLGSLLLVVSGEGGRGDWTRKMTTRMEREARFFLFSLHVSACWIHRPTDPSFTPGQTGFLPSISSRLKPPPLPFTPNVSVRACSDDSDDARLFPAPLPRVARAMRAM
jgi:hypothetical protein